MALIGVGGLRHFHHMNPRGGFLRNGGLGGLVGTNFHQLHGGGVLLTPARFIYSLGGGGGGGKGHAQGRVHKNAKQQQSRNRRVNKSAAIFDEGKPFTPQVSNYGIYPYPLAAVDGGASSYTSSSYSPAAVGMYAVYDRESGKRLSDSDYGEISYHTATTTITARGLSGDMAPGDGSSTTPTKKKNISVAAPPAPQRAKPKRRNAKGSSSSSPSAQGGDGQFHNEGGYLV